MNSADAIRQACFAIVNSVEEAKQNLDAATVRQYTAVLVEPDRSPATPLVLKSLLESLDTRWGILFFHGEDHASWAAEQVPPALRPQISFRTIPSDRRLPEFLTSRNFLEQIPTETFLLLRTDSIINARQAKKLEKFLQYDYVGAPWPWDHLQVGNGHLSLRKKSVMLRIINEMGPFEGDYEDQYFSYGCVLLKANVPSREVAREFCVSQLYHAAPFGFHRPWDHLPTRIEELCRACPELRELRKFYESK